MAGETLSRGGIVMPPVDAEGIVRSLAQLVAFGNGTLDGFTIYDREARLHVVYVNALRGHDGRERFTWAHEVGHIVLGHLHEFDCNRLREEDLRILDREADIFATELLMPRMWIEKFVPVPCDARSLGRLKDLFGVSWQAFIARLDKLGMQSAGESRRLLEDYAANRQRRELDGVGLRPRAR